MKTIKLDFDGYWTGLGRGMLESSGIYCVYIGIDKGDSVQLKELIYIGESTNVKERICQHIKKNDWKDYLEEGYSFCYSNASVESSDRERTEAALIFHYKPKFNDQHKYNYGDYAGTTIKTDGKNRFIEETFVIQ